MAAALELKHTVAGDPGRARWRGPRSPASAARSSIQRSAHGFPAAAAWSPGRLGDRRATTLLDQCRSLSQALARRVWSNSARRRSSAVDGCARDGGLPSNSTGTALGEFVQPTVTNDPPVRLRSMLHRVAVERGVDQGEADGAASVAGSASSTDHGAPGHTTPPGTRRRRAPRTREVRGLAARRAVAGRGSVPGGRVARAPPRASSPAATQARGDELVERIPSSPNRRSTRATRACLIEGRPVPPASGRLGAWSIP